MPDKIYLCYKYTYANTDSADDGAPSFAILSRWWHRWLVPSINVPVWLSPTTSQMTTLVEVKHLGLLKETQLS